MARAFSDDLRGRVIAASRVGMSAQAAAARFGIGISTAIAWIASSRLGQLKPARQGRRRGSRLDEHEAFHRRPDRRDESITLNEMVARLSTSAARGSAEAGSTCG
jgi:transposase